MTTTLHDVKMTYCKERYMKYKPFSVSKTEPKCINECAIVAPRLSNTYSEPKKPSLAAMNSMQ